jgi:hypothetical protein
MEGAVRSALYLYPKKGDYAAVLKFFRIERVLELSKESGGFMGASINVPTSNAGPMLILASWAQEADYLRWVASPVRAEFTPRLAALLEREPAAGEMYSIVRDLPA